MSRPRIKYSDEMDTWLESEGYFRKRTARDSTCLFRAVSEQLLFTQIYFEEVRRQAVEYELRHKQLFQNKLRLPVELYTEKMINEREAGGDLEIEAMARMWKRDFLVFKEIDEPPENVTNFGFENTISLCQTQDGHFDSVYTEDHVKNSAFCQSLIYTVLYKKVFKLKEVDYAVNKMLHDKNKAPRKRDQPNFNCANFLLRLELRETADNMKELLSCGITPFPYKVAKALDPQVYRNVEYDTWSEYRKGLRCGFCAWTCRGLQVGVRCSIQIDENTTYEGHVQEMKPNQGPVVVFVEKLGEKITVPYKSVTQLPPLKPILPNNDRPFLRNTALNFVQRANSESTCNGKILRNSTHRVNSKVEGQMAMNLRQRHHSQTDFEVTQDPQVTSTTDTYEHQKEHYEPNETGGYSSSAQISEIEEPDSTTNCDEDIPSYPPLQMRLADTHHSEIIAAAPVAYVASQPRYHLIPHEMNFTSGVGMNHAEGGDSSFPSAGYISCTYSKHLSRYYGSWSVQPTAYLSPGIIVLPPGTGYIQAPVYSSPQEMYTPCSQGDHVELNEGSAYPCDVHYQSQPPPAVSRDAQSQMEPQVQHYEVSSTTTYTTLGSQPTQPMPAAPVGYQLVERPSVGGDPSSAPADFYSSSSTPHHIATPHPIEFDVYECVPIVPSQEYVSASYLVGPEGEMYEAVSMPAAVVQLGPPAVPSTGAAPATILPQNEYN